MAAAHSQGREGTGGGQKARRRPAVVRSPGLGGSAGRSRGGSERSDAGKEVQHLCVQGWEQREVLPSPR